MITNWFWQSSTNSYIQIHELRNQWIRYSAAFSENVYEMFIWTKFPSQWNTNREVGRRTVKKCFLKNKILSFIGFSLGNDEVFVRLMWWEKCKTEGSSTKEAQHSSSFFNWNIFDKTEIFSIFRWTPTVWFGLEASPGKPATRTLPGSSPD